MRKIIFLSFILLPMFFLSGCSYSVPFIIENRSRSNITIEYQTKNFHYSNVTPYVMNLIERDKEDPWKELSKDKYKIDETSGIIEINLAPNQGFKLTNVDPFWTYHEPYGDHFNIKMLNVSGENGSLEIKGNQVFEIFEPQKVRWNFFGPDVSGYIFRYKESETHEITK